MGGFCDRSPAKNKNKKKKILDLQSICGEGGELNFFWLFGLLFSMRLPKGFPG